MKQKRIGRALNGGRLAPYLFVAPNFVIMTMFYGIPLLIGLWISFTDYDGFIPLGEARFIGANNYQTVFRQSAFIKAGVNTLQFTVCIVPLVMTLSIMLAWLLSSVRKLKLLQTIAYVPTTISAIAVGLIWRWIFDSDFGIINSLLTQTGLQAQRWFEQRTLSFLAVLIATLWSRVGYFMVLFLAAMENIPKQYYEAARIDGASAPQSFWNITLPLLKPTNVLVLILNVIEAFKAYALVYALTRGGPIRATTMMVQHIYETSFIKMKLDLGNAMSMVLFVGMLVFTIMEYAIGRGGEIE